MDDGVARPIIVALEGPSGVGKSALATALAGRWPGSLLLREAYDRCHPRPSLAVPDARALRRVETALLREDRRRWSEASAARRLGRTVWADTGFLGPFTYAAALARIDPGRDVVAELARRYRSVPRRGALGWPDLTVYLHAPAATIARRARADARAHPAAWRARHAAVARWERRWWREVLGPALGRRYLDLDARAPAGALADRLTRILGRGPVPPMGPAEARRRAAALRRRLERALR